MSYTKAIPDKPVNEGGSTVHTGGIPAAVPAPTAVAQPRTKEQEEALVKAHVENQQSVLHATTADPAKAQAEAAKKVDYLEQKRLEEEKKQSTVNPVSVQGNKLVTEGDPKTLDNPVLVAGAKETTIPAPKDEKTAVDTSEPRPDVAHTEAAKKAEEAKKAAEKK